MAPASPDLRIIRRLWAVSMKALMLQQEHLERGSVQGGGRVGRGGARGREKDAVLELMGETKELDEQTGQRRRHLERGKVMEGNESGEERNKEMQPQLPLSYISHGIWALDGPCEDEWSFWQEAQREGARWEAVLLLSPDSQGQ